MKFVLKWRWRKLNKFFTVNDEQLNYLDDFKIPAEWWSRPYEYAFSDKFLKENEKVIDAGCGIEHPFKFYAAKRCKKVYAIDRDKRLESLEKKENIEYICSNLESFNLKEQVDKIFCISVLEHIPNPLPVIDNFAKNIKEGGQLILTVDFPLLKPELLVDMLKSKFIIGKQNYKESEKDIYSALYKLKCYSLVAKRKCK
jgi:2-polyprenyl-3-methyl-5-hydroxy-6-metoxy-1,4-benzoquinol methylase